MPTKTKDDTTLSLLKKLVRAIDDKKAESIAVLDVGTKSSITDYLVLANGNSEPHLRALRIEAEKILDAHKAPIAGLDTGGYGSGWTVVDAYQIMVHLFTPGQRENYALDQLWKDAQSMDIPALLTDPKPTPKRKATKSAKKTVKAVKKTPARKTIVKKTTTKRTAKKTTAKKRPTQKP